MSKTLLTGTAGGIVGAVTTVTGILWSFITYIFLNEINNYLTQLTCYILTVLPYSNLYGIGYPLPLPYYPSASLFSLSSFILSILLLATGILIGVGFYGTYKIGGGATGLAGPIFGIIGITSGALLIILGNLTTEYMYTMVKTLGAAPNLPVPTPNFPVIWIGFLILGVAFIILGSAIIYVREMTEKPNTSAAAGTISILGAVFLLIGGPIWVILLVFGFGLIFVAFILWAVVFYSSRNL